MSGTIPAVDPEKAQDSELKRRVTAFALTKAGTWFSSQVGARIDPWLLRATRGRVDHTLGQIPVVLVTVRGARSGLERTVPLLYFSDGDDVILIASSYGRPKFPAWYYNLKANPRCSTAFRGQRHEMEAYEAEGEERQRLWELDVSVYPPRNHYAQRAGNRRIPVMVLEPAPRTE